jgi:hypothetical protein
MESTANKSAGRAVTPTRPASESPSAMLTEIMDTLTRYARDNPAQAAVTCFAVGFVLGWKLKPW